MRRRKVVSWISDVGWSRSSSVSRIRSADMRVRRVRRYPLYEVGWLFRDRVLPIVHAICVRLAPK